MSEYPEYNGENITYDTNLSVIAEHPINWVAVLFRLEPNQTTRQALMLWQELAFNSDFPRINLTIQTPCGRKIFYKYIDDVPDVDVPCPCGNPNHWVIKIQRIVQS
jgi:hypothetical protein